MILFSSAPPRSLGTATFLAWSARRRLMLAAGLVLLLWLGVWWAIAP